MAVRNIMEDVVAVNDGSDTSATSDPLFHPSVEMLMNDCDDERTLDEEEALAATESDDPNAELSSLQRESDMPLSELLALYGYREMHGSESPIEEDYAPSEPMDDLESETDQSMHSPKLRSLYQRRLGIEQDSSRLLRSGLRVSDEEEDEDFDYIPDEEEWRKVNKTIMVGMDYQALIPDGLSHYDDALPYENEDKLVWDPNTLRKCTVEDFLRKVAALYKLPVRFGSQIKDDEQALYLLLKCGHNTEEALRRIRINTIPTNNMSLWSEDECKNFESGIRTFGKSFHLIQQNKVRTRSIGELVQFYYLWKKSERHDFFGNKTKLEKKKYSIHPGLADFMDRFLEDQDGRDRSSSPNVPYTSESNRQLSFNTLTLNPKPLPDN